MKSRYFIFARQSFAVTLILLPLTAVVAAAPRQFTADLVAPEEIRITRFDDVVAQFLDAGEHEQARFAEVAIETMIAAYQAELERSDLSADAKRADDWSWHAGTRRYVERLQRIAVAIRPGSVQMIEEPHGAIRLVIAGEQVMLGAPRFDDQAQLERSIAEHACSFSYCLGRGRTVEERVAERTARLDGGWVFSHNAPPTYSSADGLQCIFDDRRHLKLKKKACTELVNELRLLTEAIGALRTHRKTIDWRHLRIEHVGAGKAQKVTYSASGSFVRMRLPSLLRAESVWRSAIPWIKASLEGRVTQYVIDLPDQLVYLTSTVEN